MSGYEAKMRAVRLQAVGRVELAELSDPHPGPGEIRVRSLAAGICGTDRHLCKGEFPCTLPVTRGHEFSGEIIAPGEVRVLVVPG
jgi:L-iditol 2-dehydrogenase